MKLRDWMIVEKLKYGPAAKRLGLANATSARRFATGEQIPGRTTMLRIYLATGGLVTPNDFYDLPALSSPGEALAGQEVTVGRSLPGQAPQSEPRLAPPGAEREAADRGTDGPSIGRDPTFADGVAA